MKPKKSNAKISLALAEREIIALNQALLFLMHCDGDFLQQTNVSYETIVSASDKLENGDFSLSRGQLRACIASAKEAIQQLTNDTEICHAVANVFPELIPDLKESLPVLEQLLPRLRSKFS